MQYSTDFEKHANYLSDEAHLLEGQADRIYFPETENQVIAIIRDANTEGIPVTISGGGTGLASSRVPMEGWIIATDKMTGIFSLRGNIWRDPETGIDYEVHLLEREHDALLTVPVSMTIKAIQNFVREKGWFYPPDPTERSSFIGGNVAANASGARSFKYGATRDWVQHLRVVTPEGYLYQCERKSDGSSIIGDRLDIQVDAQGKRYSVPRPQFKLPSTRKNVAGPVITDDSHTIDLFIGNDGIFGMITEVTLRIIRAPREIMSIFAYCDTREQAMALVEECQKRRDVAERTTNLTYPMAVEYVDRHAVKIMRDHDSTIPEHSRAVLIIEQDIYNNEEEEQAQEFLFEIFEKHGVNDSSVAQTHKEIEHHKTLRHSIPETVNSMARNNGQPKLGTDYSVPNDRFGELLDIAKHMIILFEEMQGDNDNFGAIIWCHIGDSHIHLNFLPKNDEEKEFAKKLMVQLMHKVVEFGGSIAAEHGLGKKSFEGKPALNIQYDDSVIEQFQAMKIVLDPANLMNRGNLF